MAKIPDLNVKVNFEFDFSKLYQYLTPYFIIAENHAKESPCQRRKYAALVAYGGPKADPLFVVENNSRESNCCNGFCARDTYSMLNGERVEIGAEVHAETAVLIKQPRKGWIFLMAGQTSNGTPLYGESVYPCHTCSLNIKFAGYTFVYLKKDKNNIIPVSIDTIIDYREKEWSSER